jgi:hypothetical protein
MLKLKIYTSGYEYAGISSDSTYIYVDPGKIDAIIEHCVPSSEPVRFVTVGANTYELADWYESFAITGESLSA